MSRYSLLKKLAYTYQSSLYLGCLIGLLCIINSAYAMKGTTDKLVSTLTLNDAIMLALRYNPDIENAEIQRIADKWSLRSAYYQFQPQWSISGNLNSQTGVSQIGSTFSPQVALQTPYGTELIVQQNNQTQGNAYSPSLSLNLSQPLLQGAGRDIVELTLNDAKDQEKINRLNLKNQLIQTVNNVTLTYRALQQSLYNLQTQKLAIKGDEETIKQDQILIKSGQKAPSDLIQAQSQLANDKLSLQQAITQETQNKLTLLNSIGLPPTTRFSVPQTITLNKKNLPTLAQAIQLAFANNISYQTSVITLDMQKRSVAAAVDQARAQLNLNLSSTISGENSTTTSYVDSTGNIVTVNNNQNSAQGITTTVRSKNVNNAASLQLQVPIADTQLQASIAQAKISYQQSLINFQNQKRQLGLLIMNDYQSVQNGYQELLQAQKALELEEKNIAIARDQLKYGQISTFQINQMQRDLIASRSNLASSQINYANQITSFEQDVGVTLDTWHIKVRY